LRVMAAAFLLALSAGDVRTLTNEVVEIPAKEWRYVEVSVKQVPVTVRCEFHVISGTGPARVELVNAEGLENWKQGRQETKGFAASGKDAGFNHVVSVPDEYAVLVDNPEREPLTVRLRVALDSSERGRPQAKYLTPERRLAVILISATVFFAMAGYSAKKLLSVIRS